VTLTPGGVLYGTASSFGARGFGTVFRLTPPAAAGSAYTLGILWTFTGGSDGANPMAGLLLDSAGNLYGTASRGGTNAIGGLVFELSPPASGLAYTEAILADFTGANGLHPAASLIADAAGNLYGTTAFGGSQGYGTVFELLPQGAGTAWGFKTLCDMSPGAGGVYPFSSLLLDGAGVLFGTTDGYHAVELDFLRYDPTLFSVTPPPAGGSSWTVTTLASLDRRQIGENLVAGLVADHNRRLFAPIVIGPVHAGHSAPGGIFVATSSGFQFKH